jgi:diaminohydroxyphosphoribosylaminopyrimidine deaminase/5-amino-6-(5-phosphoribosylamino)uracil reductase
MGVALNLARRNLGSVWPNPAVGCVLVKDGYVVGRGWTGKGGRPHAEAVALESAGKSAKGATAYISLEPCDHHGRTPPCSEALIEAGIARAMVALEDPDPRVSGKGNQRMRDAGIEVEVGLRAAAAADLNSGFLIRIKHARPTFTLKLATTLDGQIATGKGESRWITGPQARTYGHLLRAEHDAIMIGSLTAVMDDPELTCRLPGMEDRSPVRIVLDGGLRLALDSKLVTGAKQTPLWIVTLRGHHDERIRQYEDLGAEVIVAPSVPGERVDIAWLAKNLAERGITRVLVEGGGTLAAVFVERDMIDRLVWFRAPRLLGGDGLAAVASLNIADLASSPLFKVVDSKQIGDDRVEDFRRVR